MAIGRSITPDEQDTIARRVAQHLISDVIDDEITTWLINQDGQWDDETVGAVRTEVLAILGAEYNS